jgi:hypothetical protein
MFSNLIFNPGSHRVARKPIERMFKPIRITGVTAELVVWYKCKSCGYAENKLRKFWTEDQCVTCHERNAKKEKKECRTSEPELCSSSKNGIETQLGGSIPTTSMTSPKSPSSPSASEPVPEFKVGFSMF